MKKILILGGYGNFGKRVVEQLADIHNTELFICGRSEQRAQELIKTLPQANAKLTALALDIHSDALVHFVQQQRPFLVIHTAGPFQAQPHQVPQLCARYGSHYIDLADDRRFVCDISRLNRQAAEQHCLIVSGASSVPGLSSAVISHYHKQFACIEDIDIAIAPGNRAERGEATLRGILSYTGHPIRVFSGGRETVRYGWMSPRKLNFGGRIGQRHLANVDVPDLELFPGCYQVQRSVTFQAGLELPWLHYTMVAMAWLARLKLVKNWAPLTPAIFRLSERLRQLGSDRGAMRIAISGKNSTGQPHQLSWTLYAENGVGPYIPTLSAIILARKLINDEPLPSGAMPCLKLFSLDELQPHFDRLGIYYHVQSNTPS